MTRLAVETRSFPNRRSADWHVLSARLPNDAQRGTSKFGDDTWYLAPAERLGHAAELSLNFTSVPERFRASVKELFAQLLADDLMPAGRPYAIGTIRVQFTGVVAFVRFLDSKRLARLGDATPEHFAEYIGYLSGNARLNEAGLRAARLFWRYRVRLSDPLKSDPADMPFWRANNSNYTRGENRTARIPETVLEPLIWWSCRFIDDLSEDILRARAEHRRLLRGSKRLGDDIVQSPDRGTAIARIEVLLQRYRDSNEPLPGHHLGRHIGRPNYRALDREAGVPTGCTVRMADTAVRALAESNGVDSNTYLATELSGRLAGEVWAERLAYGDVPALTRHLQTSAYIVVAFFSGMRDSEVKHIERGCITVETDATGRLAMHLLDARTFKGNSDPAGKLERWVVAPVVQRAVAVLEALADPAELRLFKPLREGTSHDRNDTRELVSSGETNRAIGSLLHWINSYAAVNPHTPAIPTVDGNQWRFTTRQFRRTLAWFIARKPGGIAAGALQYKHLSLQMFRGYAGESESGFAAELAAEQALARGEWLGEFAADAGSVVGRAKDEVVRRLDLLGQTLGFAGHLPDNPGQLARFLKKHDPYVYRGAAVTCVFDSSKALCLRRDPGAPNFQTCEPLKCGNAVFTPADIIVWRDRADGLAEVGANESLAPRVRASAVDHAARLTKFLDSLEATR